MEPFTQKKFTDPCRVWNPSTIEKLLGNKAVTGTFVPSYRTMSKGVNEIPGYYPAVVPNKLFHDVQSFRLTPFGRNSTFGNPFLINIFRSLMSCSRCGHSIIMTGITPIGTGYYTCPMRRLHRCDAPAIRRDLVDKALIDVLMNSLSRLNTGTGSADYISQLENRLVGLHQQINRLIEALQVAPEVEALAVRVKALSRELRDGELHLRSVRESMTGKHNGVFTPGELAGRAGREQCRTRAAQHIEKIVLNAETRHCDVYLKSGLRILSFPLVNPPDREDFISAMAYVENNTLVM